MAFAPIDDAPVQETEAARPVAVHPQTVVVDEVFDIGQDLRRPRCEHRFQLGPTLGPAQVFYIQFPVLGKKIREV